MEKIAPNFVSSFRYGEHVYFLFRESAIEHINCGKTIYSRIARVCINDSGGPTRASRERWTSFVKARLNCSIPGEYPFYFDEIQASTHVVSSALGASVYNNQQQMSPKEQRNNAAAAQAGSGNGAGPSSASATPSNDLLYAVFTTPTNSIGGSAVCAFRMSDIMEAFEGPFKTQQDSNSNWLPMQDSKVPQPRPGTCVQDSKKLPDENINFIKDNPLMDTAVESIWSQPIIMMASINFRFTNIAVDPQVETQTSMGASSMRTDVIFVSTDDGRVFKLINTYHLNQQQRSQYRQQLFQNQFNPTLQPPMQPQTQAGIQAQPYFMPYKQKQQQQQQQQPYELFQGLNNNNNMIRNNNQLPMASAQISAALVGGQKVVVKEPLPDISSSTIVIEELHLFDSRTPIVNMHIHYPTMSNSYDSGRYPKLIVVSSKQLKAVPLSRCERALSCADCIALFDPYCAWDTHQQVCYNVGKSISPAEPISSYQASSSGSLNLNFNQFAHQSGSTNWFQPNNNNNNNINNMPNNRTVSWWLQCPSYSTTGNPNEQQQQVGAPFRSLFSSHFQVPNRFDYASGHHLSHTALVALSNPIVNSQNGQQTSNSYQHRQQPVSECLTYCGGLYTPAQTSSSSSSSSSSSLSSFSSSPTQGGASGETTSQLMMNCADYVQQHYIGSNLQTSAFGTISGVGGIGITGANGGNLYTSENLYIAVIICAVLSMILGLVFGFALGRNTRKHDSSICSSTFDETNLYMASTGSHHGASNLFAQPHQHLQQHQRLQHHPLLNNNNNNNNNNNHHHQQISNGLITGVITGVRSNGGNPLGGHPSLHNPYDNQV